MITTIRNAAKAVVIEDGRVLLIKHGKNKVYYTFPGGGQEHNETLAECVQRECLEEVGISVKVGDVLHVSEHIRDRHEEGHAPLGFHQIDVFFKAEIDNSVPKIEASEMDDTQVSSEWIAIDDLMDYIVLPMCLRELIQARNHNELRRVYLGDV